MEEKWLILPGLRQLYWISIGEILLGLMTIAAVTWNLIGISNHASLMALLLIELNEMFVLLSTGILGQVVVKRSRAGSVRATMFLWTALLNVVMLVISSKDVLAIIADVTVSIHGGEMRWYSGWNLWMYLVFPVTTGLLILGFAYRAVRISLRCHASVYKDDILVHYRLVDNAEQPYQRSLAAYETVTENSNRQSLIASSPYVYED
ncbi:uncharacterized protein LOC129600419 [Paramacrobiotus metropolitanus]|uniref:uncharacterized protein LOC129600419 n=1 Tax=Paramacrobiotus metropolitanus TaxID=2943436 RepID=UPI0024464215|nr:uncharacterized protein LOC129600419 [Paramacrobiotus metropolitanus]